MTGRKKNDARAGARSIYMTAMIADGWTVAGSAVGCLASELWVDGRSRASADDPGLLYETMAGKGLNASGPALYIPHAQPLVSRSLTTAPIPMPT